MIGSLGQPVLFLIALGYGFGPIYAKAGGGNYLEFLGPGVIAMAILFTATFTGIETVWDRQFGFLKETLVAPVSRFSIMLGRTLGGATVASAQGLIVLIISMIIGFRPTTWLTFPIAFAFMVLIALLFTALGTAIASVLSDMQAFPLIINFLVMPLFFLSGALFPFDGLPKGLVVVTSLNPLAYGVDGIRYGLVGTAHFPILLSFGVLAGVTLIFLGIGSYLFSKIQI